MVDLPLCWPASTWDPPPWYKEWAVTAASSAGLPPPADALLTLRKLPGCVSCAR